MCVLPAAAGTGAGRLRPWTPVAGQGDGMVTVLLRASLAIGARMVEA